MINNVKDLFVNFDSFEKVFFDYLTARGKVADYKVYPSKVNYISKKFHFAFCVDANCKENLFHFIEDFYSFVESSLDYKSLSSFVVKPGRIRRITSNVYGVFYRCKFPFGELYAPAQEGGEG